MQNKKMLPLTDRRALVKYLQDMRYRRIAFQNFRWAYNMDGIDDRWTLANRAINPDGDNTFEFWSPDSFATEQAIITQCISSIAGSMEFRLFARTNADLVITYGGIATIFFTAGQGLKPSTRYGLTLIGNNLQVFEGGLGGVLMRSTTFTRGTAREPLAQTRVGVRDNNGVFTNFFKGIQRDIKINGTLWKMDQRNQSIQPSIPAGNNMTGVNLNPDRWVEIAK